MIAAAIFFAIAASAFHALSVVATDPVFALAFAGMSVLGTIGILLDQVSTAASPRRPDVRARAPFRPRQYRAPRAGGSLVQRGRRSMDLRDVGRCRRRRGRPRRSAVMADASALSVSPALRWHVAWPLLRVGVPNHWLTLTERAPGLILPIIVTELVSPPPTPPGTRRG